MPKQLFLGANWKMNPIPQGALANHSPYHSQENIEIVVFPTFLGLKDCIEAGLSIGAQCGRAEKSGAFTGDISVTMLKELGCTHVLCGHSERRRHHGETDAQIAAQTSAALEARLTTIVCVGETADERKKGMTKEVLRRQLSFLLNSEFKIQNSKFFVAYEPIWAISGNGGSEALASKEAQEMHAFIRSLIPTKTRILYGGSLNAKNAKDLLSQPDIDGGLIGNASLSQEEFGKIIEIAKSL